MPKLSQTKEVPELSDTVKTLIKDYIDCIIFARVEGIL